MPKVFTIVTDHGEPHEFVFTGEDGSWSETFTALPSVPAGTMLTWALAVRNNEQGTRVYSLPHVIKFLMECLRTEELIDGETKPADDRDRFATLIEDSHRGVTQQALEETCVWLGETYTDRPTR